MPYAQVVVASPWIDDTLSDWTSAHWAQGFVRRDAGVSFAIVDADGFAIDVDMLMEDFVLEESTAERVIRVPFVSMGQVTIGDIQPEKTYEVEAGMYDLFFELNPTLRENVLYATLSFRASIPPRGIALLRADETQVVPQALVDGGRAVG